MKELLDNYYEWLKQNTIVNEIGEYTEVTTPFLDRHNDCIQFYMKKIDSKNIFITDDGYVLSDLEDCGFNINTPRRKNLLETILLNHHIKLDEDNCLTVTTSVDKFAIAKHFYIQGILAINDLYNINRKNVASLFIEDISSFFDDNELSYNENIKLTGKSGLDHNIEYLFSPIKRKNIPERYLKAINNPDNNNTKSTLFIWDDIKNARKTENKMYVILNDSNSKVNSNIIEAYKNYGIEPLLWSKKEEILKTIKAV